MVIRSTFLLIVAFVIALAFLVAPVAANKYVVTSSSSNPVAGADVTISAQLSTDDGTAIATSGKVVTWSKTGTGGTFLAATSTTNEAGIATATFTTGTVAGTVYTVTGTDTDSFTGTSTAITPVAGAATQIAKNAGDSQSATVSTAVTTLPSVIVRDAYNNPVSGVSVTFAVTSGGGTATSLTATTGSNGIATVGSWTLGSTAGANTLTATSGSLTGSPVTFTATGTAAGPVITGISPTSAGNSGSQTIVITGSGFSSSTVSLTKSGQTTITGATTSTTDTTTSLERIFNLNGVATGTWNLVVLNSNGGTTNTTFTVSNSTATTVTTISPTSGSVNTSVAVTITGTGFVASSAKIRLYSGSNYISGTVTSGSSTTTQIIGAFNLNQASLGTYNVCVLPDGTEASKICGPTFTITDPSATGSLYFTTNPSGADVYLDNTLKGTTPLTLQNLTVSSYKVMYKLNGYDSYSETVTVVSGTKKEVYARLVAISTTATTSPPVTTTVTTVRTTKKSTVTTPTPWPSDTPTQASPVDMIVVVGAIGLACLVLRKH